MDSKQTNPTSDQDTEFFGDDIVISESQAEGNFSFSSVKEEEALFEDVEEALTESILREEESALEEESLMAEKENPSGERKDAPEAEENRPEEGAAPTYEEDSEEEEPTYAEIVAAGYYRRAPIRTWFYTFMIMNLPIIGWIYLIALALNKNLDQRRDFARAYLIYKLVFLIVALAILAGLLYIGLELADALLEYMDKL